MSNIPDKSIYTFVLLCLLRHNRGLARTTNHTTATGRLGVRPDPYGSHCQLRHWEPRETPNWFQKGPKQIRQLAKRVRGVFSWDSVQICPAQTHTHTHTGKLMCSSHLTWDPWAWAHGLPRQRDHLAFECRMTKQSGDRERPFELERPACLFCVRAPLCVRVGVKAKMNVWSFINHHHWFLFAVVIQCASILLSRKRGAGYFSPTTIPANVGSQTICDNAVRQAYLLRLFPLS